MEQKVQIIKLKDLTLHDNVRKQVDESEIKSLAENIKQNGIIQPLIIRESGKELQVICGKRRFLAATLGKLTEVPCIVRLIPDEQVEEIQLIENLQRQDLHPMDEADMFLQMTQNMTSAILATKLNKSQSYVEKRIKLTSLCKEAKLMFKNGQMNLDQALLIARMQEADQVKTVTEAFKYERAVKVLLETRSLREWIQDNIFTRLDNVPFNLEDAELYPQAGACSTCPFRTKINVTLFDDVKDDKCTNAPCLKTKITLFVKSKVKKLEETNDIVYTASEPDYSDEVTINKTKVKVVPKNTPGAVPVVINKVSAYNSDDKKKIGKIVYVPKDLKNKGETKSTISPQLSAKQKADAEKHKMVKTKCYAFSIYLGTKIFENIFAGKVKFKPEFAQELKSDIIKHGNEWQISMSDSENMAASIALKLHKFELPITISEGDELEKFIKVNFKQADWTAIEKKIEDKLMKLPFESLILLCNWLSYDGLEEYSDITVKTTAGKTAENCGLNLAKVKTAFSELYGKEMKQIEKAKELEKKKPAAADKKVEDKTKAKK